MIRIRWSWGAAKRDRDWKRIYGGLVVWNNYSGCLPCTIWRNYSNGSDNPKQIGSNALGSETVFGTIYAGTIDISGGGGEVTINPYALIELKTGAANFVAPTYKHDGSDFRIDW